MNLLAYLHGKLVQIVVPRNGSTDIALDEPIKIQFAKDMNVSTLNDTTIKVLNSQMAVVPCEISMDPSSPTRIAIGTHSSLLEPSTRYTVIIKGGEFGVRSADIKGDGGDALFSDYYWNFTTGTQEVLPAPSLTGPLNQSIVDNPNVQFSWSEVQDSDRYQLQISGRSSFSTTIFDNDHITSTAYIPYVDVQEPLGIPGHYHWRVRAFNSAGSPGVWSATFHYYLDEPQDQDTDYSIDNNFSIVSTCPQTGSVGMNSIDNIIVEFNETLSEDIPNIQVSYTNIDTGMGGYVQISSIEIEGSQLRIQFEEELSSNTEYVAIIPKNVLSAQGNTLYEPFTINFISQITPFYSMPAMIRNDLGSFINDFSDIEIARIIFATSLWADQISNQPYGSQNRHLMGQTQSRSTNSIFFHEYVRYESSIRLVLRIIMEHSLRKGSQKQLGDLAISSPGSLVPDLNIVMKRLETNRDNAEKMLRAGEGTKAGPTSAILGGTGSPYAADRRGEAF